jgi:hypothetical protein
MDCTVAPVPPAAFVYSLGPPEIDLRAVTPGPYNVTVALATRLRENTSGLGHVLVVWI